MQIILVVVHLFLALGLIGLILIQHGKGADMGAAFGSGASSTVFGAQGSASFLTRATAALATLFFLTSMALAFYAAQVRDEVGIMESLQTGEAVKLEKTEAPTVPAPAPAVSDVPIATGVPVAPAPPAESASPTEPEAAAPSAVPEVAVPPADQAPAGTAGEAESNQ